MPSLALYLSLSVNLQHLNSYQLSAISLQPSTAVKKLKAESQKLKAHTMLYPLLIGLIWGLFAAMLFLNLYIRVKAFKYYRLLVKARVEFGASHIFNRKKLEEEILPRYPKDRENILAFVNHIHRSLNMATVLMVLITLFGAVLMYYRKS